MSKFNSSKAFSLLELIIVLVIIGIVIAIGIPGINQARTNAELETMRSRAISLQNAKLSYISAVGTQAASGGWAGQATDSLKYSQLLMTYLPSTAPANLTTYIPSPYAVALNGLGVSVAFTDSTGLGYGTSSRPLQKY